jgi:hypothetical protein
MKRINIAGLCLVAAFAFSVLIAATAQAAISPEFGQCVGGQKKGNYTESLCKTVAVKVKTKKGVITETPDHKGAYEWEPAPLATCVSVKKGFYSNSECTTRDESKGKPKGKFEKVCATSCADFTTKSGATTIYNFAPENESEPETLPQGSTLTGIGGTVKCSSSTGAGEYTSGESSSETLTLTGCESSGNTCTTTGEATGTIKAGVYLNLVTLPAGKGVGSYIVPAEEIKFTCGTVAEALEYGKLIGTVTGDINTPSTSSAEAWAVTSPSEGVEKERYFESGGSLEGGPFEYWESVLKGYEGKKFGIFSATSIEAKEEVTSEATLEVRA